MYKIKHLRDQLFYQMRMTDSLNYEVHEVHHYLFSEYLLENQVNNEYKNYIMRDTHLWKWRQKIIVGQY